MRLGTFCLTILITLIDSINLTLYLKLFIILIQRCIKLIKKYFSPKKVPFDTLKLQRFINKKHLRNNRYLAFAVKRKHYAVAPDTGERATALTTQKSAPLSISHLTRMSVNSMSEQPTQKKYSINVAQYGGITVEAPSKEECIDLFREATQFKRKSPLDEAIR